jgi:hypothetical protein
MKNVTTNESISFESTLGSPSKPHPNIMVQKPKKIFLVNFVDDSISLIPSQKILSSPEKNLLNQKSPRTKKTSNQKSTSIKNNKNIEFHVLDFDAIFKNIIIGKKKLANKYSDKPNIGKNKKKLIGSKRNRIHSYNNDSYKSKFTNLFF